MTGIYRVVEQPKQKNKASHRRLRLLMIAVICFLVWAGLTLWNQMGLMKVKAEQLASMEYKLKEIKELNEGYNLEVIRLNDSEYIEQKIRKDYHYTRNGETMFYTPNQR